MISEQRFRLKKNGTPCANCYCRTPELIENYEIAIADKTQTWECHHKLEEWFSVKILKSFGWYYDVDPSELIFLTCSEHASLHAKAKTGRKNGFYGRHHSDETKKKLAESKLHEKSYWFGKKHSDESKKKMSESKKAYWRNKKF